MAKSKPKIHIGEEPDENGLIRLTPRSLEILVAIRTQMANVMGKVAELPTARASQVLSERVSTSLLLEIVLCKTTRFMDTSPDATAFASETLARHVGKDKAAKRGMRSLLRGARPAA